MQAEAGRTRYNPRAKLHIGIDMLFADVAKNLLVLVISTSNSDVPTR